MVRGNYLTLILRLENMLWNLGRWEDWKWLYVFLLGLVWFVLAFN